jgi:hypothetical protein
MPLMAEILHDQGLSSAVVKPKVVFPRTAYTLAAIQAYEAEYGSNPIPSYPSIRDIFFVKSWSLSTSNRFHPTDLAGASAQGNPNPIAIFGDHALLEIDLPDSPIKIYDPSYGNGPFSSVVEWQDASVDGFGVQFIDATELSANFILYVGKLEEFGTQDVDYLDAP